MVGRWRGGWPSAVRGRLCSTGAGPPDPEAEAALEALRARGVRVEVEVADVSDGEAVEAMLGRIAERLPPLSGVVHSVGVLADAALANQDWGRFARVLGPKVVGAWHLHRATRGLELDLFVLFTSGAGVLGNAGQANHAAANAFLDRLAGHRRSLGLAGQAVAWGGVVGDGGGGGAEGSDRGADAVGGSGVADAGSGVGSARARGGARRGGGGGDGGGVAGAGGRVGEGAGVSRRAGVVGGGAFARG